MSGARIRLAVLTVIDATRRPSVRKRKIMLARLKGHITDDEAEDWIAVEGLAAA